MLQLVIVGVGGQGTLLASRILGDIAIEAGMDVKVSEVHGMSQRGGSVITHVRIADKGETVAAPLVEQKGADYVLAFERLEALRALPYVKDGGVMVMNDQKILPMPVITGAAKYPDDAIERISARCELVAVDALSAAEKLGNKRAMNVVMLGVLSKSMPFAEKMWTDALRNCVKPAFLELNNKAFTTGRELV